jgi:hypothetical protein
VVAWQLRSQHARLPMGAASSRLRIGVHSCSTLLVTATREASGAEALRWCPALSSLFSSNV